jgi:TolB-like protein
MARTEFDASARNRRFLAYVVGETLQGRASRIKAYTIALAVFERGEEFDPLTDPIVRIEASRLRRAIEHYYLTGGKDDRIRIDIPKGSYVPTFRYSDRTEAIAEDDVELPTAIPFTPASVAEPTKHSRLRYVAISLAILLLAAASLVLIDKPNEAPDWTKAAKLRNPSIMVMPFESADAGKRHAFVADGMTYDVIAKLTRFEDLTVFGPQVALAARAGDTAKLTPDYVLTGTIQTSGEVLRLNFVLTERQTGHSVWAWSTNEDLSTASIAELTQGISQRVVNMLAQPDGIILEKYQEGIAQKGATQLTSYECMVLFRSYWRRYERAAFEDVDACLHRTIKNEPGYAPAYAGLALAYIDRYRFGFGGGDTDGTALKRASELATRAQQMEPHTSQPYLALSLAYWFQRRIDISLQTAERGLSFNPNNCELMADLGLRYALLGKWDRALELANNAYALDPAAPTGYRVVHFLHAYMKKDYRLALEEANRIAAPMVIYNYVARAAALGQLGDKDAATTAVANLLRIDPNYGGKVRADLARRNMAPEIIDAIVDGLRKAGLST